MKGDLLWVYEGLTDIWARCSRRAAGCGRKRSRASSLRASPAYSKPDPAGWRPLQDTADAAQFLYGADGWANWRRGVDFYDEGRSSGWMWTPPFAG